MSAQEAQQDRVQQQEALTPEDIQEIARLIQADPELAKMLGLAGSAQTPQTMERMHSHPQANVLQPIARTSPLGIIQDARASMSHATRSASMAFASSPGYYPSNNQGRPWIWMTVIAAIAGVTVASCFAVVVNAIANNSPNSNITAQQEANAALMMEVAKAGSRPNVTCLFAWNCPTVPVEQPTEIKGSQLNVSYGVPQGVDPKAFQGWVNYWNEKSTADIHEAANTFTPKMCSDRPGMCDALNAVKAARMQQPK